MNGHMGFITYIHTHTLAVRFFFALDSNGTCGCRPFAKTEEAHGGILKPLSIRLCVCVSEWVGEIYWKVKTTLMVEDGG